MRNFVRCFAALAVLNTLSGIDLLARGKFFEPASPEIQIYSWAMTVALGVWALCALARDKD